MVDIGEIGVSTVWGLWLYCCSLRQSSGKSVDLLRRFLGIISALIPRI